MKIIFLISDDYVWAPKVLRTFLEQNRKETVAVAAIVPEMSRKNVFRFILVYLNLLYPILFFGRVLQSIINRFRARFLGHPVSVKNIAKIFELPYKRIARINAPETRQWLSEFSPDLLISIQTQYLESELQKLAPLGVVNVHPSKLPAYRGPAPIFWTLYNGEKETALTAHFVNEKFDDGPIVAQKEVPITEYETYYSLGEKITTTMPELLLEAIERVRKEGPFCPNEAFEGCYHTYPNVKQAFSFHCGQLRRMFKKFFVSSKVKNLP